MTPPPLQPSTKPRPSRLLSLAKILFVATLACVLLMPHALKYLPGLSPHFDDRPLVEPDWLHAEIPPGIETLEEEAARLSAEIDALVAARLNELNANATITALPPHVASPDLHNQVAESAPQNAQRLFVSLLQMKGGVTHDPLKAETLMELFESIIDPSNSTYTHFLGQAYWEGWNRPQDFAIAFRWFEQSRAHGSPRAVLPLIACHAYGIGTPRNPAHADSLRAEMLESFFLPREIKRIDAILAASRIPPPLFSSLPQHGQTTLAQISPVFPRQLHRRGISGRAHMQFQVDAAGFTHNIKPVFFTHPEFARAAAEALTFWRVAARVDPETGLSEVIRVPIVFNITDDEESLGN